VPFQFIIQLPEHLKQNCGNHEFEEEEKKKEKRR
jgi:hypothetical protein